MKGSDRDSDVLLDFPLAGEVQHVAGFFAAGNGRLQEMLYTGGGCGIGQALALFDFTGVANPFFPEILHGENAMAFLTGELERHAVIEIACDNVDATGGQRSCGGFVRVAGQGAYGKAFFL